MNYNGGRREEIIKEIYGNEIRDDRGWSTGI